MALAGGKARFALLGRETGKELHALEAMDSWMPFRNPGAKSQTDKQDKVVVQAVDADTQDARKAERDAKGGPAVYVWCLMPSTPFIRRFSH
jgi:hypothetical protein